MKIDEISTPAYVCEEQKLVKNLEILRGVGEQSATFTTRTSYASQAGSEAAQKFYAR